MDANRHLAAIQSGMLQPNSILPSQYFGSVRKLTPEQRLMIAVLQDAIDCVAKHRHASDCRGRRLFAETAHWILAEEADWPFSFASICAVLDIDVDAVRGALRLTEGSSGLASPAATAAREKPAYVNVAVRSCDVRRTATVSAMLPRRAGAVVRTSLAERCEIG